MKIGILTKETHSTYLCNLIWDLSVSGFNELFIIKLPQGLAELKNKLKSPSFSALFQKVARFSVAYLKYIKVKSKSQLRKINIAKDGSDQIIKILSGEQFDIVIAYNSGLLDKEALGISKFGIICAHPSLLPIGRGFYGRQQSILTNTPLGVTVFKVGDGIDTGDIYLQEEIDISQCKNIEDLNWLFSRKELELTVKTVLGISRNSLLPRKQEKIYRYWKLSNEEIDKGNELLNKVFLKNRTLPSKGIVL
jgi:methionyl-tRNA formyltransferase